LKFLAVVFCTALSLIAQEQSIESVWSHIELQNDSIQAENADVKRAELKKSSAKSMYLPSISITGSYTRLSEPVNIDVTDISSKANALLASLNAPGRLPNELELSEKDVFLADLHFLWPLYTGGKIDAAQKIYASALNEAKAKASMKKDVEFLKLVKYYYGVVVSKSLLLARKEAQKALELHYENAKKMKEQGQIANIELLNAEVKLDAAKIETTKATHKLEIAQDALDSLAKEHVEVVAKLFVSEDIRDEEYYKKETARAYAGLKILDAKEAQSKSLVEIKKAAWHPEVLAYGNYNLYKDESALMQSAPTWFAGVMVKINLLQRQDRSEDIQAAELLSTKVTHLKLQALRDLKLLVEKTYKEMLADYEEFYALNSSIKLANENYKLRSIAFREGLSTSVELVDAEMFLMGAKTKRLNAAYNYVQKVAQLAVLSGNRELFFEIQRASEEIE